MLTNSAETGRDAEKRPSVNGFRQNGWRSKHPQVQTEKAEAAKLVYTCGLRTDSRRQQTVAETFTVGSLAPQVGLEPTTLRLTAECSTIELLRSKVILNYSHKPSLLCQPLLLPHHCHRHLSLSRAVVEVA